MKKNRLVSQKKVETENILESITNEFSSLGLYSDDDEIFIEKFESENCRLTVFVVEDYYFRINSTLVLTVIIQENVDKTTVDIISGGGKTGLFGLSYGAEKSAAKRIVRLLKKIGFIEQ